MSPVLTRLSIRALAHGGAGIGQPPDPGPTWFVPGALPNEVVEATSDHEARRYVRGSLVRVIEASPDRTAPPCVIADRCGGCSWQHVRPSAQARFKREIVANQLRHVVPAEKVRLAFEGAALGYRRRVRMHYEQRGGEFVLGFRAEQSHDLVDVSTCMVLVPALDRSLQRLRSVADVLAPNGQILALTDGSQVVVGLPGIRPEEPRMERLQTLLDDTIIGIEVRGGRQAARIGRARLEIDAIAGLAPLRLGPFSFAQAQGPGGLRLIHHVARAARAEGLRVLELHAGDGNFTRALATMAKVWASDTDEEAIESLRELTRRSELPIRAHRRKDATTLSKLIERGTRFPVVVLDPPRAGLGENETRDLCRVADGRIVYVSCDPATLARDLAVACKHGFAVQDVAVFDLMPMTPEVEAVATLVRRGTGR